MIQDSRRLDLSLLPLRRLLADAGVGGSATILWEAWLLLKFQLATTGA
jgi:hypothetical protein